MMMETILEEGNKIREEYGLPPLTMEEMVAETADRNATETKEE